MPWTLCIDGSGPWCLGWLAEKLLFPGFLGVLIYRFAVLQLRKKREIDFAEKQLAEFYAPMLGARSEILSHTKFDQDLRNASYRENAERLEEMERRGWHHTAESTAEDKEYRESLARFFEKINYRLLNERIDSYIAMRRLFAQKMAYADEDTRRWYDYFYRFVEMWRAIRDNEKEEKKSLSPVTVTHLGSMFDEGLIIPFYEHLQQRCDDLQIEIAGRRLSKRQAPQPPPPKSFVDGKTAVGP